MSGRTTRGAAPAGGVSPKRILAVLLPILGLIGYMVMHSNFLVGRALWLAFPGIESTYKGAWPTFTGTIIAYDVTVYPFADPDDALHFDRVRVDFPMFQWYMSAFYKRSGALKPIRSVRLVFDNAKSDGDVGFTGQLLAFGDASASPFEAEGCAEDGLWIRPELFDMGLTPGPTRLSLSYRMQPGRLIKEQILETPGVSRVHALRELGMRGDTSLLSFGSSRSLWLESDRWTIQDEGFIAARNRLCARKDGVSPQVVAGRHTAVLQRLLALEGVQLGNQAAQLYGRFSERGGTLELDLRYATSLNNRVYDSELGNWVPHIRGTLALDSQRVDLGLRQITPRPVSERLLESEETMLMVMAREGTLPPALLGPLAPKRDELLAIGDDGAQEQYLDVDEAAALATGAALKPAALARLNRRGPDDGEAPAPIQRTTTIASDPAAMEASRTSQRQSLAYRDLLRMVGARVRVHSMGSRPRVVEIVAAENGVVKVRQRAGSGWAQYDLSAKTFVRAEPMP